MGDTTSAAEGRKKRIRLMGGKLGPYYDALWQKAVWLCLKWSEYSELYAKKSSRVQLLNQTAPQFFHLVQFVLLDDIIIGIAKFLDPNKTCGKENLSINGILDYIDKQDIKENVKLKVEIAQEKCSFCRDLRNRRLAHFDLNQVLQPTSQLPTATYEEIEAALKSICEVLDSVSLAYENSTTFWDYGQPWRGAKHLLHVLQDGLVADKKRHERWERREYLPEDFNQPDI